MILLLFLAWIIILIICMCLFVVVVIVVVVVVVVVVVCGACVRAYVRKIQTHKRLKTYMPTFFFRHNTVQLYCQYVSVAS